MAKVNVHSVAEELEILPAEWVAYYNKETGEIRSISEGAIQERVVHNLLKAPCQLPYITRESVQLTGSTSTDTQIYTHIRKIMLENVKSPLSKMKIRKSSPP